MKVMNHQTQQKKSKIASRKHFSADALFKGLHKDFLSISDPREGETDISMAEGALPISHELSATR